MVHLRVDPNAGEPLGLQIARQLRLAIASGRLAPGERLPGSREMAGLLGVNFHTVRKAYADLETDGLLRTVHGLGTFVADHPPRMSASDLRDLVRVHLERLAEDLAGTDVDPARQEALLLEEWHRVMRGKGVRR